MSHKQIRISPALVMWTCLGLAAGPARAATDLTDLSLDALLEVPIVGASKYEQRQNAVAAAASVITRKEIKTFGWRRPRRTTGPNIG